jgi:hypothetical protein
MPGKGVKGGHGRGTRVIPDFDGIISIIRQKGGTYADGY